MQIVVGLKGPQALEPTNPGGRDPLTGAPAVLREVRSRCQAEGPTAAVWHWVPPLDHERARQWLTPVADDVVDRLVAVSGGDDFTAWATWQRWIDAKYVVRDEAGEWQVSTAGDPAEVDIERVLQRRLPSGEGYTEQTFRLRNILGIAALSGSTFSGEAVCEVVASTTDLSRESVEELIDAVGPTGSQPWLVDTDGYAEDDEGGISWRYRFASEGWANEFVRPLDEERRERFARDLYDAGVRLHAEQPLFDLIQQRLALRAGEEAAAEFYAHRIEASTRHHRLMVAATLLLNVPTGDPQLINDLSDLCNELLQDGATSLAVRVGTRAHEAVAHGGSVTQRAIVHLYLGRALTADGAADQAIWHLANAVKLLRALHDDNPDSIDDQRGLAIALKDLGGAITDSDRPREAIGPLTEAVKLQRALHDADPDSTDHQLGLIGALVYLGRAFSRSVRPREAIGPLTEAVKLQRALHNDNPASTDHQRVLAIALEQLGFACGQSGRDGEAIGFLTEAVKLQRALHSADPDSIGHQIDLAGALNALGIVLTYGGPPEDAIGPLTEAVKLRRALRDAHPASTLFQSELAIVSKNLADAYRAAGRPQ